MQNMVRSGPDLTSMTADSPQVRIGHRILGHAGAGRARFPGPFRFYRRGEIYRLEV